MYLDYAENRAARPIPMRMSDWVDRLDAFLKFNGHEILTDAGQVSAEIAKTLVVVEEQSAAFRAKQDESYESDFERKARRIENDRPR